MTQEICLQSNTLRQLPRALRPLGRSAHRCGDCLLWSGAASGTGSPAITYKGRHMTVRRWVFEILRPDVDLTGLLVAPKCLNRSCVAPWHLVAGTRSEIQAMQAVDGRFTSEAARAARTAAARRHRTRASGMSMEKAREIRRRYRGGRGEKPMPIARSLGLSVDVVRKVALNKTWRERAAVAASASVFTLAATL